MNEVKHYAHRPLAYARLYVEEWKWFVFPIKPLAKYPALVRWAADSSNDPNQIAKWWSRWPEANIGLDCGRSDITVVDIDQHSKDKDGRASLDALQRKYGRFPPTLRSRTPTGGIHYFFKGGGLRNTVGALGPGIDTRGNGGMVLLPGSRTEAGAYCWLP
jgi:putative DNA primase/helicase